MRESSELVFGVVSSGSAKSSQGRRWRWCIPWRTTHMPFHAAMRVEIPMMRRMIGSTRHPRPAELNVMRRSARIPRRINEIPRPRAKMTRGRLPLQMVQRMKLGWAWRRREYSALVNAARRAEGCVVCWRAWRTALRSRSERLS
jgi:hypothetical protein